MSVAFYPFCCHNTLLYSNKSTKSVVEIPENKLNAVSDVLIQRADDLTIYLFICISLYNYFMALTNHVYNLKVPGKILQ